MERDFDYLALWQAVKRAASGRAIHKTVLVAGLVVLHSLFGLGIIRRAAIAQEVMGQYRWRIAAGSTVLAADSENAIAGLGLQRMCERLPSDVRRPGWQIRDGLAVEQVRPGRE